MPNKRFKRDNQRVAFLLCVGFCGYGVVLKLGSGVGCPLTGRYATEVNLGLNLLGFLRPFVLFCRQMSIFTLKFVVYSSRKTGKVLCLPQSVFALVCCEFSVRKVWKGQVYRAFCTC